jgi:hypothetical protein
MVQAHHAASGDSRKRCTQIPCEGASALGLQRAGAHGTKTWHGSCFIGADQIGPMPAADFRGCRYPRGGRIEAGQLDWAAAEPAEFVNQEIGYE